ncbi:SAM-dependent DNA methyltransferase, partial [Burkholderia sp. SIMBA_052]
GRFIINTYDKDGVVDLSEHPLLEAHLTQYEDQLKERHVAKNSPSAWYKTIDRVYPERARRPKLMIPDIKSELTVVYEEGRFHPNNSIYYICS